MVYAPRGDPYQQLQEPCRTGYNYYSCVKENKNVTHPVFICAVLFKPLLFCGFS